MRACSPRAWPAPCSSTLTDPGMLPSPNIAIVEVGATAVERRRVVEKRKEKGKAPGARTQHVPAILSPAEVSARTRSQGDGARGRRQTGASARARSGHTAAGRAFPSSPSPEPLA